MGSRWALGTARGDVATATFGCVSELCIKPLSSANWGKSHVNCAISLPVTHHMSCCDTETHTVAEKIVPVLQKMSLGSDRASPQSPDHARSDKDPTATLYSPGV